MIHIIIAILGIVILGLLVNKIFQLIKIPALIGYIILGLLLNSLNLLPKEILNISSEIRKVALVIILLKAGLGLSYKKLLSVGRPALLLSFLPAIIEMSIIGLVAPLIIDINYAQSFLLGSVIGAVSPAILIPRMTQYIDEKRGINKGIPHMLIAGASIDDIVMIVFFQIFFELIKTNNFSFVLFLDLPLIILSGLGIGYLIGVLLRIIFKYLKFAISVELIIIFIIGASLLIIENKFNLKFSAFLAIIIIAMMVRGKSEHIQDKQSFYINKSWKFAEIFLFVMLGASIKSNINKEIILSGIIIISIGLVFRMIAVFISLIGTNLDVKEKIFVGISYLPKATVQAVLGAILLDYAIEINNDLMYTGGMIVLAISVISIILTAPTAAIIMDNTYKYFLNDDKNIKEV